MKNFSNPIQSRQAALAALLLILATASGCGSLPTAPSVDSTATPDRSSVSMTSDTQSISPIRVDEGSGGGSGGGGSVGGSDPVPAVGPTIGTHPISGPGNSDWGHSHKKPKKNH